MIWLKSGSNTFREKILDKAILKLSFLLLIVVSAEPVSAEHKSSIPEKFSASIGGFLGQSYWVTLEHDAIVYSTSPSSSVAPKEKLVFHPTTSEWNKFQVMLNEAGIWSWEKRYEDPNVADGTQWNVEVKWGERFKQSSGDNAFPEKRKEFK
jgi:hypothetical protein